MSVRPCFTLQLCFERLVDSKFARLDAVYAKYELLYYH